MGEVDLVRGGDGHCARVVGSLEATVGDTDSWNDEMGGKADGWD